MIESVSERERERESERQRESDGDKAGERGPLLFSKQLVNDSNPIKQGEQLAPAHNMH